MTKLARARLALLLCLICAVVAVVAGVQASGANAQQCGGNVCIGQTGPPARACTQAIDGQWFQNDQGWWWQCVHGAWYGPYP